MLTSKISPNGQFSLPPEIVRYLQIGPGDTLGFRFEEGRIVIRKVDVLEQALHRAAAAAAAEADAAPASEPIPRRDAA